MFKNIEISACVLHVQVYNTVHVSTGQQLNEEKWEKNS